jgi:hypothetical protein
MLLIVSIRLKIGSLRYKKGHDAERFAEKCADEYAEEAKRIAR